MLTKVNDVIVNLIIRQEEKIRFEDSRTVLENF